LKTISKILLICVLFFHVQVQALDAYFDFNIFYIPGKGPMVETYLNFFGESLTYDSLENGSQATVEITMMFFRGDEIVEYSKKNLSSKLNTDSVIDDMLDQQRFMLDYGEYVLEIHLREPSFPDRVETFTEVILVEAPESEVYFSDVQWIAAFKKSESTTELTKSGYDILPFVSNYMPRSMNRLMFYTELYGTDILFEPEEPFLVRFFVKDNDNNQLIDYLVSMSRHNSGLVIPIMKQFDITNLPTGNYNLVFEIVNKDNELVATKTRFFQRTGTAAKPTTDYAANLGDNAFVLKMNNVDTLHEYIACLTPIAGDGELSLINRFRQHKDIDLMQRFFYNFWVQRDKANPEIAWNEYFEDVKHVQRTYGTPSRRGYDTDMGRVYLTYGRPDVITDRPSEPNAYPYQIWQYFRADRWTNVRFVFYDRTLLQHDYELLHCDKVPGEIKNPRWDMLIHQRDTPLNNVDRTRSRDHFGGRTQDFWETPR
jgi:GWxTD domain-containing protein